LAAIGQEAGTVSPPDPARFKEADMELNALNVLMGVGQTLVFATLIYFFYLVLEFGNTLHPTAHEGDQRPLRQADAGTKLAMLQGEPEHGRPSHVLDEIAASAVRMAREAR
jgi:hypothetical protein